MASLREQLSTLGKGHEVLTIGQLEGAGISDQSVTRLVRQEALIRVDRGLYRLPDGPVSRNHEIICVATISPSSVIVLLSALAFHEIGTQQPHEVWVQLRAKGRVPELQWPKLRVVRTRISELFELGVETHHLGGQHVRITSPARTVADCFKHRSKVGLETCIEAARETVRAEKATIAELADMAKSLRVLSVMQPYLEVMG